MKLSLVFLLLTVLKLWLRYRPNFRLPVPAGLLASFWPVQSVHWASLLLERPLRPHRSYGKQESELPAYMSPY